MTVVEHQYLVTEKSPLIPDKLPTLRDPDLNFYLKSEPGALAIGGWERGTIAVNGLGKLPLDFGQELFGENLDRLSIIAEPAAERIPVLNEVGIRTVINGPIPVSADGEPVMGIAEGIENFFIACGFTAGIAASGGAGLAMANWIANGDPGMDLWPFDLRRFGKLHNGLAYLRDAAIESYARYYVIAWPEEEREACRPLRRSALHAMLAANGAVHGQKFGFERPNYFLKNGEQGPPLETFERSAAASVVGREHKAIREGVALIDMSSFSKFEITGPGALRTLQWLAAGNIDKGAGAVVYTQLLNAKGGIEADLTIMQPAEGTFYVVTGSGFGVRDGGWIRRHMPRDGSVAFKDVSSAYGVINLCGPLAREVLGRATENDVSNAAFPYMTCRWIRIGYAPVMAARITYLGELGWELHIPTEFVAHVYETLARRRYGVRHHGCRLQGNQQPADGKALPLLERRHLARRHAVRGGPGLRGRVEEGRLPRPRRAACPKGNRTEAPARMFRAGNAPAGLWRGGDVRQRQGDRHDHQRRFRPLGRPFAGARLRAAGVFRPEHAGNRGLRPAQPRDAYRRLRLRSEKRAGEGMSRKPPAGAG